MKNNNKKIIHKLSGRSLKNNRMRNLFAVVAIGLTSLLFTALFTLGSGMLQMTEEQTMRQIGTKAHGGFKSVTRVEYEILTANPLVKDYGYDVFIGIAANKEFEKRQTEIRYVQPYNLKFGFMKLEDGKLPEKKNEIVLDTIALDLLQIPRKVGEEVALEFDFLGKEYNKQFILSGWYQGDPVIGASTAYVSEEYLNELKKGMTDEEIRKENEESLNRSGAGLYQVNIMFKNSMHIEKNMMEVLADSGLKLDDSHIGINWAYMTEQASDIDMVSAVMLAVVFLVMVLTGFLIIYNIFHISILNDIRFYGLLKTIGTTKKQIKTLVIRQAMVLSLVGIPIGLLLGFLVGKIFMPVILHLSGGISVTGFVLKGNPCIFLFGTIFSLFTVWISCRKPSRIAGSVSPIEALKYTGDIKMKVKNKRTTRGAKISRMALTNLARNKKKTGIVILSLSLSVILLTEIVTLTKSFSLDEYLESMLTGDAMIFSSSMINYRPDLKLSEEFYQNALHQDGVEEGNLLYHNKGAMDHTLTEEGYEQFARLYKEEKLDARDMRLEETLKDNRPISEQRYAYDEVLLKNLRLLEGTLDLEKFRTGNYVIVAPLLYEADSYYHPGDIITLNFTGANPEYKDIKDDKGNVIAQELIYTGQKKYEVMAVADIPYGMTEKRFSLNALTTILSKNELLKMDGLAEAFAASFQVEDEKEAAFTEFLDSYTTQTDPGMAYQTKESLRDDFASMVNGLTLIGCALAFVIAIVGILNFINTMLTSVISRKREFAMLQSIGLSNDQLKKLLLFEGIYYILFTAAISLAGGSFLSLTAVRALNNVAESFNYQFTLMPFLETIPVFLAIVFFVPSIAYRYVRKYSIVERLREE
ncbi:putative ABC transport system permease protein [Mobilisporobacter senegalensis]|uniref:Putative ABC transport system permease protein n=1 Tax=Mobilisporobacter senegalensis TaxID=1329262 RepID=A0A3N1XMN8_9FIRM|nr:ABC transporter permease [Mobilisporobacter senegalensis]ROR26352.1 putative ABC transport system permease protein [Mobilisporobacter senegalensis]